MDVGYERDITQSHSQETLRRVKENDESLTRLWIGGTVHISNHQGNEVVSVRTENGAFTLKDNSSGDNSSGVFNPSDDNDFISLGEYIAENSHPTKLIHVNGRGGLDVECLKHNSSIQKLGFLCGGRNISAGAIHEILQVYREKGNLTWLFIESANLQHGGVDVLVTLRSNPIMKSIKLCRCSINDQQFLPIVEAIRGHSMLEELDLDRNSIGNASCEIIVTLLDNPNSNIHGLGLGGNTISNEGAITIANGLANNKTLQKLVLRSNPIDESVVEDSFCKVLCNTSSINSTYSSNHMLKRIVLTSDTGPPQLVSLLKLNEDTNKNHVAIKKILKYHPIIDMGPMFEWDAEDEQSLKALPHVISWFERAGEAVTAAEDGKGGYNIEEQKLDVIFQFARAMPLLFVPASPPNDKAASNKRKRGESM